MNNLKFYHKNIVQYELINKFNYKNIKNFPTLKKIVLNFKNKNLKIKSFSGTLFTIELIAKKKCTFTTAKKSNLFLKIQKKQPIGGKIVFKKIIMYNFLSLLIIEVLPKITNYKIIKKKTQNNFSLKLNNKSFLPIKEHYNLINLFSYISLTLNTNLKNQKELFFLLKSFKFFSIRIK